MGLVQTGTNESRAQETEQQESSEEGKDIENEKGTASVSESVQRLRLRLVDLRDLLERHVFQLVSGFDAKRALFVQEAQTSEEASATEKKGVASSKR